MSEICTFTINLPVWFLWAMTGALYLTVVLAIVKAVSDYKLKRLKLHISNSQARKSG